MTNITDVIFSIFIQYIRQNDPITDIVDSDHIIAGLISDLNADSFFDDSDSCIIIQRRNESFIIKEQGFKSQYRLRLNFQYEVFVCHSVGEAKSNELSKLISEELLKIPYITYNYGGSDYTIMVDSVSADPTFRNDTNFFVEAMIVNGFSYPKLV